MNTTRSVQSSQICAIRRACAARNGSGGKESTTLGSRFMATSRSIPDDIQNRIPCAEKWTQSYESWYDGHIVSTGG